MTSPLYEAASIIRAANLNVTVELVLDDHGDIMFNLRGTYWRGSQFSHQMFLVCERSMDDALILLSNAVYQRLSVPLDWRARMYRVGVSGTRAIESGYSPNPPYNPMWLEPRAPIQMTDKPQDDSREP